MSKEEILTEWLTLKATTVNSKNKLEDIKRYCGKFLQFSNKEFKDFDENDLAKFLIDIKQKYAIRMQNDIKVYLKGMIKWYFVDYSTRFRNLDKLCRTQTAQAAYSPEQMLKKEDIEKIIQTEPSARWKAYFSVLYYGGFRPSELCNLRHEQITFDNDGGAFIKVYVKKNKRDFIKYIPAESAIFLKQIINNGSEWVFPSLLKNERKGQSMSEKGVYARLVMISQKALGRRIPPYLIRHSIATIVYNDENLKDDDAAAHMGHSKNMKRTYDHNNLEKIKEYAKKIWIKPTLTAEQKNIYETKIKVLEDKYTQTQKEIEELKFYVSMISKNALKQLEKQ